MKNTNQPHTEQTAPATNASYYSPFRQKGLVGAADTLKNSWEVYKGNWKTYIKLMLLFIAIFAVIFILTIVGNMLLNPVSLVDTISNIRAEEFGPTFGYILTLVILSIVILILGLLFQFSLLNLTINLEKGMGARESIKTVLPKLAPLIWTGILQGIIIMVGFMLFIIPGIYFAIYYSFGVYVCMTEGVSGMAALKRSKEIVKGFGWGLAGRFTLIAYVLVIVQVIGAIPIIGWLVQVVSGFILGPVTSIFYYSIYENFRDLKKNNYNSDGYTGKDKLKVLFFILLPVILFIIGIAIFGIASISQYNNSL